MEYKTVTEEMRKKLRAPLPKEAVKANPSKTFLSTIKPIFVIERLNDVFGIGSWQLRTDLVTPIVSEVKKRRNGQDYNEFTALMKTTFTIPAYNIYFECVAGSNNEDEGDSAKGGTTDGLTKICSWLEIGIDIFKGLGNNPAPVEEPQPAKVEGTSQPAREAAAQDAQKEPDIKYATAKQKEEIIRLLNNPVITRQEKTKMLLNINKLDEERAKASIAKLKKVIEDRESEQAK